MSAKLKELLSKIKSAKVFSELRIERSRIKLSYGYDEDIPERVYITKVPNPNEDCIARVCQALTEVKRLCVWRDLALDETLIEDKEELVAQVAHFLSEIGTTIPMDFFDSRLVFLGPENNSSNTKIRLAAIAINTGVYCNLSEDGQGLLARFLVEDDTHFPHSITLAGNHHPEVHDEVGAKILDLLSDGAVTPLRKEFHFLGICDGREELLKAITRYMASPHFAKGHCLLRFHCRPGWHFRHFPTDCCFEYQGSNGDLTDGPNNNLIVVPIFLSTLPELLGTSLTGDDDQSTYLSIGIPLPTAQYTLCGINAHRPYGKVAEIEKDVDKLCDIRSKSDNRNVKNVSLKTLKYHWRADGWRKPQEVAKKVAECADKFSRALDKSRTLTNVAFKANCYDDNGSRTDKEFFEEEIAFYTGRNGICNEKLLSGSDYSKWTEDTSKWIEALLLTKGEKAELSLIYYLIDQKPSILLGASANWPNQDELFSAAVRMAANCDSGDDGNDDNGGGGNGVGETSAADFDGGDSVAESLAASSEL